MSSILPHNNTAVLVLEGLQLRDGTYQNAATVELLSLVDVRGASVSGITYPLALTYVTGSNGNYEVEISADVGVKKNKKYLGTVRATQGGRQFESVETIIVQPRTE